LGVKQHATLGEIGVTCWERNNKYELFNPATKQLAYVAKEDSECLARCCCAPSHEADVRIYNATDVNNPQDVAYHVYKPFKCTGVCCALMDCCQPEVEVYRGPREQNQLIGTVKFPMCGGGLSPKVDMMDAQGNVWGNLDGPTCCVGSCCPSKFSYTNIKNPVDQGYGIEKKGADGIMNAGKELFTDADNFVIAFDPAMTMDQRGVLLASMFLLDFMFFEDDGACDLQNCTIKLCDLYCCGCKMPCKLNLSQGDGE
jgi:hypothetical protein